jgi:hypothetical protein
MRRITRVLVFAFVTVTSLLATAVAAAASADYPPTPPSTAGPGPAQVVTPIAQQRAGAPGGGALATTGSDLKWLWIGLVLFVVGVTLAVAARRRAALRRRALESAAAA